MSPGIRCHDQDDIAEINCLAVIVRQFAVIHHLQQNIEQIRVRFFDFIQQQYTMRMLVDFIGHQSALLETDIAGRRADQTRYGMALHIFRHIKPDQFNTHGFCELFGDLGFTDTSRAGEQIAADRLFRIAQSCARHFDGIAKDINRLVLIVDQCFQITLKRLQSGFVVLVQGRGGDAGDGRNHILDIFQTNGLFAHICGYQHLRGANFINNVDGLVGQFAVTNIFCREFYRALDGIRCIANFMVLLVIGFDAMQNFDGIINIRFIDIDFLEAANERAIFLEIIAVFLIGRGADTFQLAVR